MIRGKRPRFVGHGHKATGTLIEGARPSTVDHIRFIVVAGEASKKAEPHFWNSHITTHQAQLNNLTKVDAPQPSVLRNARRGADSATNKSTAEGKCHSGKDSLAREPIENLNPATHQQFHSKLLKRRRNGNNDNLHSIIMDQVHRRERGFVQMRPAGMSTICRCTLAPVEPRPTSDSLAVTHGGLGQVDGSCDRNSWTRSR